MTDCVIRNVSMQANAKVTDEVIKEQVEKIESLLETKAELQKTVQDLKNLNSANESAVVQDLKNKLTSLCSGDYIFQIDADEMPNELLIKHLPPVLELNPDNEVYLVPRVNTVEGLTDEHIAKWGWHVMANGWVNWPDYQWRIWKNKPEIKWMNKVHEKLEGFTTYSHLPADTEAFCLYHPKTIQKQVKQNNLYDTI